MQKLIIPGELATMNEIIAKSKSHYAVYSKLKKRHTENVIAEAAGLEPVEKAHFVFSWHCRNKRKDPDNIAAGGTKMILDGLVEAGVMKNDGWGDVASITHHFYQDKERPRVEVEIYEVRNGTNADD